MPSRPKDKEFAQQLAAQIGGSMRRLRRGADHTQAVVASEVGMSVEAYSRLERGRSLPSFPTMMRVCRFFETTPDTLLLSADNAAPSSVQRGGQRGGQRPSEQPAAEGDRRVDREPSSGGSARRDRRSRVPRMRNPPPADAGERREAELVWLMEVMRRLDHQDRRVVHNLIHLLGVKAGVLPGVPDDMPEYGTLVWTRPQPPKAAQPSASPLVSEEHPADHAPGQAEANEGRSEKGTGRVQRVRGHGHVVSYGRTRHYIHRKRPLDPNSPADDS